MIIQMTNEQRWLSRRFILYRVFSSLWFVSAIWLYFYRLFITDQQVGILDGMAFAIGLLAEVPSGALADKFGRDRIVRLGHLMAGGGLLIQAAGSDIVPFFVGQTILMVGASFTSGADDALFFDRLQFDRGSKDWRKLVARATQINLVFSLIAYTVGGYLHTINPRIPWVLNGLAFLVASMLIYGVTDNRPRSARQKFLPEIKDYFNDIKTGFRQFGSANLRLYVPIILTVQGLFYATGWGLLRLVLLDRFHFSPFWGSVTISACSLITVGLLAYLHRHADELSEKRVVALISIAAFASLLLSLADIGTWGFVVLLALYAGERLLEPFLSEVLNNHATEQQRATVLSVASFLRMLPYIALAPLIGALNTNGDLEYFLVGWSILIAISVLFYMSHKKRDERVRV